MLPNIIYLHSHDSGRYISPYGHAVATPNLQRLAREGVLFRNAFCTAPTCSPSRASLLTGQWAHCTGMLGLAHLGFALSNPERLIPHLLKRSGYHTFLAGIQHITPGNSIADLGYDVIAREGTPPEAAAADFLQDQSDKPFFLDVGFWETHREKQASGNWGFTPDENCGDPRFGGVPSILPDVPEIRQDYADFRISAGILDQKVGQVLAALDRSGMAEDTIVVFTTDHGLPFPGMKCNLTGHGLGVALVMRFPRRLKAQACDALVSHVDLLPTLCELIGLKVPFWVQGTSLLPVLNNEKPEVREATYGEVTFHVAYEPKRSVRTRRWSYIRNFLPNRTLSLPNCDDSPSKKYVQSAGWFTKVGLEEELYDLILDPMESNNLAGLQPYVDTQVEMKSRLDIWMRATNDPLLAESISLPGPIRLTKPGASSPLNPAITWTNGSWPVQPTW